MNLLGSFIFFVENLKKIFKMEMEDPKETHIQIEDEHIDSKHNNTTVRTHTSHIVKFLCEETLTLFYTRADRGRVRSGAVYYKKRNLTLCHFKRNT